LAVRLLRGVPDGWLPLASLLLVESRFVHRPLILTQRSQPCVVRNFLAGLEIEGLRTPGKVRQIGRDDDVRQA
jgi:hypothetical protein